MNAEDIRIFIYIYTGKSSEFQTGVCNWTFPFEFSRSM